MTPDIFRPRRRTATALRWVMPLALPLILLWTLPLVFAGCASTTSHLESQVTSQRDAQAVAVASATDLPAAPSVDTFTLGNGKMVQVPRGTLLGAQDAVHRMPMELVAGLMFVTATVDGVTGLFIVDTGNPVLLLNVARITPGPVIDSAIVSDAVGSNTPVLVHAVKRFTWADVTVSDVGALGMNLSSVEAQLHGDLKGRPVLGIVGLAQLGHFVPVFDYANHTILLYPPSAGMPGAQVPLPTPTTTVPMVVSHTGVFVSGTAGGKSFVLRLDSGDDGLGIDTDFADELGSHVVSTGRTEPTMGVGGVIVTTPVVLLDRLMIGTVAYDSLPMRSHRIPDSSSPEHPQGNLGSPFFTKYRVGLDLRRKVLYLWTHDAT